MPSKNSALSPLNNLTRSLGESGEKEYRRLLRVLNVAEGQFTLLPIESDFRPALRDALLKRLRADLTKDKQRLHVIRLSRDRYDLSQLLESEISESCPDVVAVVGLEETPGIVPEGGAQAQRPPALAVLNALRESLRQRIGKPLLLWCAPYAYSALLEHAPDFFDHYTTLFTFLDAMPVPQLETDSRTVRSNTALATTAQSRTVSSQVAVQFYEEQVEKFKEPTPERARALLGLAQSLLFLAGADQENQLKRARDYVNEALTLLSPEIDAYEWARAQFSLGLIFENLSTGARLENLRCAIACYEAALRVYTEDRFPFEWAMTQGNLGVVYGKLPSGDRAANLQRAISRLEAALRVCTEDRLPLEWAKTQNNLGNAYANLPTGDRAENLRRAIACYDNALRVRAEDKFPYEYAETQYNRSLALQDLGEGHAAYEASMAAMRAYGSPANKDALLTEITQRIVTAFHPQKIVLFGSYAKGKQREGSDLDLLVIMDSEESRAQRFRRVYEVAKIPFLEMDLLVYTPDEITQRLEIGDFFIKEILSEGKVLYSRDAI